MREILRQHNAITEARYEMSSLEKNIVYMLMAVLKEDNPPKQRDYELLFSELEDRLQEKISWENLIKASQKLVTRRYIIVEDNGDEVFLPIASSFHFNPSKGIITLGVTSMAHPYLVALKENFTEFQLDMALSLVSKYSKRLYEMLCQYKDIGTFKIKVQELKNRLMLVDPKTGEDKYKGWTMFEKNVLKTPQKELSEKTDISFEYKAIKTWKKYTDLEFKIRHNPVTIPLV